MAAKRLRLPICPARAEFGIVKATRPHRSRINREEALMAPQQAVPMLQSRVAEQRSAAVAKTVARIRAIEQQKGVTRDALAEIKAAMLELASHREFFPREDFPLPEGKNAIYRLAEDPDHRFAMYMSCGAPGKRTPPHDHTTWAVIVGVEGEEENFFYERTDDQSAPGKGQLRQIRDEVVRHGTGVTLMPEDIHHIQTGTTPNMHLHMYGLSLEHLPSRVQYNVTEGTYKVFPANPNIIYTA
jgi:predicted metal-dependent enzyme (double-stranded beta helix superfamily)